MRKINDKKRRGIFWGKIRGIVDQSILKEAKKIWHVVSIEGFETHLHAWNEWRKRNENNGEKDDIIQPNNVLLVPGHHAHTNGDRRKNIRQKSLTMK